MRLRRLDWRTFRRVAGVYLSVLALLGLGLLLRNASAGRGFTLIASDLLALGLLAGLTPVAALLGATVQVGTRNEVYRDRYERGRCMRCGYSRRGVYSQECPECGTPWGDFERDGE